MKARYTVIIGLIISVVLLGIILAGVDLDRVRMALTGANYAFVVPSAVLLVAGLFTRALRWRVLLADRVPVWPTFNILNVSYLLNGALPFRLGELGRIFLIAKLPEPVSPFTAVSTILVERLLDLLTVIGMLGVVLTLLSVPPSVTSVGLVMGVGSVVGVVVLVVLARQPDWAFRLLGIARRLIPLLGRWPLEDYLARFLEGLQPLTSWRSSLLAAGWTLVSWVLSVVAGYILLLAFFPQSSWTATMLFIVMASLAVSVPYAPGAVGPYEAGVVMALNWSDMGQPEGTAVAFAIVLHVLNTAVYAVMGVIGLLQQGVTLGQVMRGARHVDQGSAAGAAQVTGLVD
jgi:uncharacterized protein (TIRG00374 family)